MKKDQECIGVIEKVSFPNRGIARVDDERVLVKNTIPGQKVRLCITKAKKGRAEGLLQEVLERSPLEVREPACPHFDECGGCSYQRLEYEEQLRIKAEQVKVIIDGAVADSYSFEGIAASPQEWGYRNKMEFSFGDLKKNGPLTLGLHRLGGFYDIIVASDCKIVNEDYNTILVSVLDFCRRLDLSYYHKITHKGYLRHLVIRRASTTGEILVNLVTTSQWEGHNEAGTLEALKDRLLDLDLAGSIVGILHSINDSMADVVQSDRTEILHGKEFLFEEMLNLFFKISTFSFFQTNSFGAEVLYKTVREFIGDTRDKIIFDLYTGTGTIAQILAPVAKKVIGVEIVEEAVAAAKENAMLNDLSNCEFIAGDVLKVLSDIEDKPDIIVLDPPREGINPKALTKIIAYGVSRIVYISCKPTSLAFDLAALQEGGYRVERVKCCDLFPQTPHVETVCLLSKIHAEHHIEVNLNLDEIDLTASESRATY